MSTTEYKNPVISRLVTAIRTGSLPRDTVVQVRTNLEDGVPGQYSTLSVGNESIYMRQTDFEVLIEAVTEHLNELKSRKKAQDDDE